MRDTNWLKYAVIGGVVWLLLGFRAAIFALVVAASYDLWKKLKNNT